VLLAMSLDLDRTLGAVRLSAGRWTTTGDVDRAADLLTAAAGRLRTGVPRPSLAPQQVRRVTEARP
jgi:cysteine sulfinate desulfinase/cysteine desulfurase-like protein